MQKKKFDITGHLPLILSLMIAAAAILTYIISESFRGFLFKALNVLTSSDQNLINRWVKEFSFWGPLLLICGFIMQMILFVAPSWVFIIISIMAYGPLWGGVISLVGIIISSTMAYYLGQSISEETLRKLFGVKTVNKLELYISRYGFFMLIISRVSPFLSNDAVSFVSGSLRMGIAKFLAAIAIGAGVLIILTGMFASDYDRLKSSLIWISIVNLIIFILYIIWDRRKAKKLGLK